MPLSRIFPVCACPKLKPARNNHTMQMTPVKIGFVLLSNSKNPTPSTRIAVLNMFPHLREANFDPHIVFDPAHDSASPDVSGLARRLIAEQFQIVCFQKVGGRSVVELAEELTRAGIRTAFIVCDVVDAGMAAVTDVTIVVTDYLRSLYPPSLRSKIYVVHDGIEQPDQFKVNWSTRSGSLMRPLRAVLVTSSSLVRVPVLTNPPSWLQVVIVGRYPPATDKLQRLRESWWQLNSQAGLSKRIAYLRFLANARIRRRAWDPVGVYETMREADLAIIPIEPSPDTMSATMLPSWRLKSENRLTMKMGVGLPVIASPIPSYEQVIEHGRNGFLAHSRKDWLEHLDTLREPTVRREVGEQARRSVLERYSKKEQARLLVNVLSELVADRWNQAAGLKLIR